jgi:hypothetical protein
MANTILPGYPRAIGGQLWVVADHYGPASYTTNGESIPAPPLRLSGIDWVNLPNPAVSASGTYSVSLGYASVGLPVAAVTMRWYVLATGLEVANGFDLSAETIRMQVIGGLV